MFGPQCGPPLIVLDHLLSAYGSLILGVFLRRRTINGFDPTSAKPAGSRVTSDLPRGEIKDMMLRGQQSHDGGGTLWTGENSADFGMYLQGRELLLDLVELRFSRVFRGQRSQHG